MGALPSIETQMQLAQANIQKLMWANAKQLIKEQEENPNSLLCALHKGSTKKNMEFSICEMTVAEYEATRELRVRQSKSGRLFFSVTSGTISMKLDEERESLSITVSIYNQASISKNGEMEYAPPKGVSYSLREYFYIYADGGFCTGKKNKKDEQWSIVPATLSDLFYSYNEGHSFAVKTIMSALALSNPIWKDIRADYMAGSAYAAIPVKEICEARTKGELLANHYGVSLKRFNKDSIGQGIFLCKASKFVNQNELQKLFGFDPGLVLFDKHNQGLIASLSKYIMETTPGIEKPVHLARGRTTKISAGTVRDGIKMAHKLRRKIPLTFRSASGVYQWHNDLAVIIRNKRLPTVTIPKNSIFKGLKMPPNCIRLKNRKMFYEEGSFQNNCVATYIEEVNDDECSIWSMRKEDGTRNTIEIRCRSSKSMPYGYYYIAQMLGYDNSNCPEEDYEAVKRCIEVQAPNRENFLMRRGAYNSQYEYWGNDEW